MSAGPADALGETWPRSPARAEEIAFRVSVVGAFAFLVLSRALHLAGPGRMLDGDEAIAGLMAKHVAEGRALPIYFYGQRFGLSIVESLCAAAGFRLFGVSPIALEASTLALWTCGAALLVLAVREVARPAAAAGAAWLIAVAPAWFVWSHKTRGGYVTGFVAAQLLLWLVARCWSRGRWSAASLVALGAGAAVAAAAQPVWLLAVLPFFALPLRRAGIARAIAWCAAGAAIVLVAVEIASAGQFGGYWAPSVVGVPTSFEPLWSLRWRVGVNLSGAYHMAQRLPVGAWARVAAVVWSSALAVLVADRLLRRRARRAELADAAAIAAVAVCGFSLLIEVFSFRYLLPLCSLGVVLAAVALDEAWARGARPRAIACGALAAVVAISIATDVELSRISFSGAPKPAAIAGGSAPGDEWHDLETLVERLRSRGIGHVYSLDFLLQWPILFASREAVIARWTSPVDRVPAYPRAVDAALRAGRPVAVVGYLEERPLLIASGAPEESIEVVAGRYVVFERPTPDFLRRAGFSLNQP